MSSRASATVAFRARSVRSPGRWSSARRAARGEASARRPRGPSSPQGRRSSYFTAIFVAVTCLVLLGLIMVLSASAANALRYQGSSWYYFRRHLMWVGIGAVVMVAMLRIDYRRWERFARAGMIVAVGLLVAVLVPGLGVSANGATRWLGRGPLTVQPSELAKLALVVFCAHLLARRPAWDATVTVRPVLAVFGVVALLLMMQPNLGTTLVLAAIVLALLFGNGVPLRSFVPWLAVLGGATLLAAVAEPYRMRRLVGFSDVWANRSDESYQTFQSLVSVANGGITGTGLGASRGKWGYLPFAHTDFIFSITAEELGLVGAVLVIALFLAIGVLGFAVAAHAPCRFGMLLAMGITAWILVQAFTNIGVTLGLLPVTGVPLPFLSFGGSSLVVTMAACGILLNIARQVRT